MIRVTLQNINELGLPLTNNNMVLKEEKIYKLWIFYNKYLKFLE